MRIKYVFIFLFVILFAHKVSAQNKGFGIGIILGEPTGVSVKTFTGTNAFDAAAAWSFADKGGLHLHADYLFHNYSLIKVQSGKLPLYYGFGARLRFRDKDRYSDDLVLGARFPIGLSYEFTGLSADLFFELVPILNVVPKTDFDLNGALGFRYYIQ